MREKLDFEGTLYQTTPRESLSPQISEALWDYARAFLRIGRPSLKFLWRAQQSWLAVTFEAAGLGSERSSSDPKMVLTAQEVLLPGGITVRELDVITLVSLGLTNAGVAERLGTSPRTVSTQLERLMRKLSQTTRGGLAAFAFDAGLLRLPLPGGAPEHGGIALSDLELAVSLGDGYVPQPGSQFRSTRPPIPLGCVLPSDLGGDAEELRNGAVLAVEEINRRGGISGRPIKLIMVEVDTFNWSSVRAGLEVLFHAEVAAICAGYVSSEHSGFLDMIADYGRPFLHIAAFGADVVRTESDPSRYAMVFQTCASEIHYGSGLLRFVRGLESEGLWTPRHRRILSLGQASPGMQGIGLNSDTFTQQAGNEGWEALEAIRTSLNHTDWDHTVRQAHDLDPDVLFVANYLENDLVGFQEALQRNPLQALVYTVYAPSIPSFLDRLGAQANGVVWATTTGTYGDDLGRDFRRKYAKRFSVEPGWSQAGAAFDQVHMLASAWAAEDPFRGDDVVSYLRRSPHRGVNGVYYFDRHRHEPLLYPDTTQDVALSQAHLVYQIQDRGQVLLAPEPFGHLRNFKLPSWMAG